MKIFFRIFLALIVLVIATVVAIPFFLSPNYIAEQVVAQVKERTGRTLTFGEDPSFSIFPDIAITLKNASLSNPPGISGGNLAAMKSLKLKVALAPLMQKRVEVKEFILQSPKVNLLVTGGGKVNWSLAEALQGGQSGTGSGVGDALVLGDWVCVHHARHDPATSIEAHEFGCPPRGDRVECGRNPACEAIGGLRGQS